MATNDRSGLELHRRLSLWLGADAADDLMNRIPPISWTDVATTGDVERLGTDLRAEFRADLSRQFDQLRAELPGRTDALDNQLRSEIGRLGTELRGEIQAATAAHRVDIADLRTEFTRAMEAQTRRIVGFALALTGLALTAARFVV